MFLNSHTYCILTRLVMYVFIELFIISLVKTIHRLYFNHLKKNLYQQNGVFKQLELLFSRTQERNLKKYLIAKQIIFIRILNNLTHSVK